MGTNIRARKGVDPKMLHVPAQSVPVPFRNASPLLSGRVRRGAAVTNTSIKTAWMLFFIACSLLTATCYLISAEKSS